jgi:hypothetical protein
VIEDEAVDVAAILGKAVISRQEDAGVGDSSAPAISRGR